MGFQRLALCPGQTERGSRELDYSGEEGKSPLDWRWGPVRHPSLGGG
jgi:hypothetical protein